MATSTTTTTTPEPASDASSTHPSTSSTCSSGIPYHPTTPHAWALHTAAQRIDTLNSMALTRALEMEKTLSPSHPDWPMYALVRAGSPVFKHRWMLLLYSYWVLTAWGLLRAPSLGFVVGAFLVTYLYIELYGAVLHVNLDNPSFLSLPVLWEACLEFQYHHVIPTEITLRSYPQIASDLNLIVGLHFLVTALVFHRYGGLANPFIHTTVACGMLNAYLLEWAHRQAHFSKKRRHPLAQYLQDCGLLVSEQLHRRHHQTFDIGFPVLSGLSEPVINFVRAWVCANEWVWLVGFLGMTLGGLPMVIAGYLKGWERFGGGRGGGEHWG